MSEYKGFIAYSTYKELVGKLRRIVEVDGLMNKIHHLYTPDTDMADIICENFQTSKRHLILDLAIMLIKITELAKDITNLSEQE